MLANPLASADCWSGQQQFLYAIGKRAVNTAAFFYLCMLVGRCLNFLAFKGAKPAVEYRFGQQKFLSGTKGVAILLMPDGDDYDC